MSYPIIESLKKVYALLPEGDLKKLIFLFLMMVLASFLTLLGIGTIPAFVAVVLDPRMVLDTPVIGKFLDSINIRTPQRLVGLTAGLLIVVFSLKNAYLLFYDYVRTKYMLSRRLMLQNRLFNAYMSSPYTWFISRNSSEFMRNVNTETSQVMEGILKPSILIALHSIMAATIIIALFIIEPFITGVGVLVFGGVGWLFLRLTKKRMEFYGSESIMHRNWMTRHILQGLGGFKDARVLNREHFFLKQYDEHAGMHRKYDLWRTVLNGMPQYFVELVALMAILFIAVVMILQFRELNSIITVLALYGASIVKIKPSLVNLMANINTLRYSAYSVDAVHRDLVTLENRPAEILPQNGLVAPLPLNRELVLNNISFTYPNSKTPAVKNITLTIPKNRAVAFVGSSGAGKTTLADVILGLLKPQKGTITSDGAEIFSSLSEWHKNIGYIPQFIYLMDDTIRRNICFGMEDHEIDEEQLELVIEIAQLGELVNSLENGVDTVIGERGVRLSGGQRQRIGIARALYHNPQLLIMDEATSALDNITEKFVVDAFNRLKGEITIIMIAHRLTTVQNCDVIYLMKDAEIIAQGTYEELIVTSKEFREMSLVDEPG